MKPKLLDLFCCQGGAAMGYHRAGFEVVGVDIAPQPRYPFEFVQGDALKFLLENHREFDAVHASPPCQAHTNAQKIQGNEHPDYIESTRELLSLIAWRRASVDHTPFVWVIENVPGAPLQDPFELCGCMFLGLGTYRPRLFEANRPIPHPANHREHRARVTKMGRPPVAGEFMHIVGNFSGVEQARAAMGIPWATREGLREAIPPAYTEHIGRALIAHLEQERAA